MLRYEVGRCGTECNEECSQCARACQLQLSRSYIASCDAFEGNRRHRRDLQYARWERKVYRDIGGVRAGRRRVDWEGVFVEIEMQTRFDMIRDMREFINDARTQGTISET